MIHEIIGKDFNAPNCWIESVVDVYEEHDYWLDRDFAIIEQNTSNIYIQIYSVRKNINLFLNVSITSKYLWAQLRFYKSEEGWEVWRTTVPGRTMQELITNINEEIDEFKHKDISKLHSMVI